MWKPSLAIAALVTSFAALSSPAAARDYPFCLREGNEAGPGTCYYQTYAQCQAAASGRYADCYSNPRMAYGYYPRKQRYAPEPGVYGSPYPGYGYGIPGNPYAGGGPSGANQATINPRSSNEIGSGR